MARIGKTPVLFEQEVDLLSSDFRLSPRETEVVRLLFRGMSDKQIASQMRISFGTERTHVSRLFRKCGVGYRRQLIGLAFQRLRESPSRTSDTRIFSPFRPFAGACESMVHRRQNQAP